MNHDKNHALFTGVSPSCDLAPPSTVAEAKAALAAHQATRPDHMTAHLAGLNYPGHPLYLAWVAWCDRKAFLEAQLLRARNAETRTWTAMTPEVIHTGANGRPRHANPSKDALRMRKRRSKDREESC